MIINIYDKNSLEIIGRPFITNFEAFKSNPVEFYPDWNNQTMLYSLNEVVHPKLVNGEIVEKTRLELVKEGVEQLNSNEIIRDDKIVSVELRPYEYIENNTVKYKRDDRIEELLKELKEIQVEYSESEFVFQEKYKQKNRELDQNNLSKLITMFIVINKQAVIKGWKFKDLNGQDIYTDLTAQDALVLAQAMEVQTKKSMHVETTLHQRIIAMSDEELKEIDLRAEFVKLWSTIKI